MLWSAHCLLWPAALCELRPCFARATWRANGLLLASPSSKPIRSCPDLCCSRVCGDLDGNRAKTETSGSLCSCNICGTGDLDGESLLPAFEAQERCRCSDTWSTRPPDSPVFGLQQLLPGTEAGKAPWANGASFSFGTRRSAGLNLPHPDSSSMPSMAVNGCFSGLCKTHSAVGPRAFPRERMTRMSDEAYSSSRPSEAALDRADERARIIHCGSNDEWTSAVLAMSFGARCRCMRPGLGASRSKAGSVGSVAFPPLSAAFLLLKKPTISLLFPSECFSNTHPAES